VTDSQPASLPDAPGQPWTLPRSQKVVLVVDLVESVRLMAANEHSVVTRWQAFASESASQLVPAHQGRLVKSLGDGLMVEFDDARMAVHCAIGMHALIARGNSALPPDQHMALRAGLNSTHVYTDALDIYGSGVNLAARLAGLAGPGETVVSTTVRDELTDELDARIEDLGDCYLKHIVEPVRAYRVGSAGAQPLLPARDAYVAPLQPTIAVIPFESRTDQVEHFAIGELIADSVIGQLGRTRHLSVISRLSSTALRGRGQGARVAESWLGADYVLSGSYVALGRQLLITAELTDAKAERVLWAERLAGELEDLFQVESELGHRIAAAAHEAIMASEVHRAVTQPLPTLKSYSLLLGAITLMHRASYREFGRAHAMLERLAEMHGRHALPNAWMATWYVLKVAQGWSEQPDRDANAALSCCNMALDKDSQSALAIAVTGQVQGYLKKDLATAESLYRQALACNPNESLAWLWLGMNAGFRGESDTAVSATSRALALSPLDPLRYYYESLAASAAVTAGDYPRGIELAQSSIRRNCSHSSTYRALAIGQALSGQVEQARSTVAALLRLEPSFTISQFIQRMPGARSSPEHAEKLAHALRAAGLPE
jgi:adenylate cyclase